MGGCLFKGGGNGGNLEVFGTDTDGRSRQTVGFVEDDGDAEEARRDNGGKAGVPTGCEEDGGALLFQEAQTLEDGEPIGDEVTHWTGARLE